MIANLGNVDHKVYKFNKNEYILYSKLKYTSNKNLSPYCVGDWVMYSNIKCLIFSDSLQKNVLMVVYVENNKPYIKLIDKEYICGIVKNPDIADSKYLSVINIKKSSNSKIYLCSKNGKTNYGTVGDEFIVKEPIFEFDYDKLKHDIINKDHSIFKDIPERYIIHGIVDYTAYHFHKPYRNQFFTQYNPFWDKLYHGVHLLWEHDKLDITPNENKKYTKIHVGDIFIDKDYTIYIASIEKGVSGFYSFKHFQFHTEKYYRNKGIKLFAVNSKLNVIPLISLLTEYGLTLNVKIDICNKKS